MIVSKIKEIFLFLMGSTGRTSSAVIDNIDINFTNLFQTMNIHSNAQSR